MIPNIMIECIIIRYLSKSFLKYFSIKLNTDAVINMYIKMNSNVNIIVLKIDPIIDKKISKENPLLNKSP